MTDKPANVRVFSVKTRFQEMARRPGGVPRELAIQQAQMQIGEFKAEFEDWVDRELDELSEAFKAVSGRQISEQHLNEMYMRCRQLRDTGTTMGLELITFVSDNLCRVLDAIKAGAPYEPAMIDCHIDALFLAKKEPYRNLRPSQLPEMTQGLNRVLERANRSSGAAE